MFRLNRSFLALARGLLFGLILLALALWFLFALPIIYPESGLVKSKANKRDVSDEVDVIDEAVSNSLNESDVGDEFKSCPKYELDIPYENLNNDTLVFACVVSCCVLN